MFLFIPCLIYPQQAGLKYLKNYSRQDYGEQPQNWAVVQDQRGVIYVGNNGCVLEFDGGDWRIIYVKDKTSVRSLAIDENGTIYVGSHNEMGYLAPTVGGSLEYVSLRKQIHDEELEFSLVRRIHAAKEGIYFQAWECLLRWNGRKFRIWKPRDRFDSSFLCNGIFYIRDNERGLFQMEGDALMPVPGGDIFADAEIFMMAPHKDKKLLIATRVKGCYLYDGKGISPFPTGVDGYLKEKKLYHGIGLSSDGLPSGDYALATLWGGVVIIDSNGHLKQIFDKKSGLQDNNVKYVYEDGQGHLWLGLHYGISRIEYASPFSLYDAGAGLPPMVVSVVRHRKNLYAAANTGIFVMKPLSQKFEPVDSIQQSYHWSLLSTGDSLLAATSAGVIDIEDKRKITGNRSYVLLRSKKDKKRIWVGTNQGLVSLYYRNGGWEKQFEITEKIKTRIGTIVEDPKGNLWLGLVSKKGVVKIDFPPTAIKPAITCYDDSHGLPLGEIRVFWAAGQMMFGSKDGLYCFDAETKRFRADLILGEAFTRDDSYIFLIVEDKNKNIWIHAKSRNYRAEPRGDGTYEIDDLAFLRLPQVQVNSIYPDGNTVWFGSNDNLTGFDTTYKKKYTQNFQALIRDVQVIGKDSIFAGAKTKPGDGEKAVLTILSYGERNLHFEFAAPFFEGESATQYQYFMEGYKTAWSGETFKTQVNYTNLNAGTYKFRVRAKNIYGHSSREDVFVFRVLPPWFLTWWAFFIYALAVLSLVTAIVKWRSAKLQKEKQKLEQTVKQRTTEINEKNFQLEKQTFRLQEQSEKLREMANVKSRFFANISHEFRTPLTLILGPLDKMIAQTTDTEQGRELNMMHRNSQRLLRLINQLLDLSKLDSGKMKLNAVPQNIIPFIIGIVSAFESLALQKKVDLNVDAGEAEIVLSFDPEKLEEVMCNLLINAVKFTPPGGKVTVSAERGRVEDSSFPKGYLELSVRDTGVGIPREQLGHIFDRFYQTGDVKQPKQKGSGIGLALARELVLLHQGKINVHSTHSSEGKNSGTEFVIRLPVGKELFDSGGEDAGLICKKPGDIQARYMFEDEGSEPAELPPPIETGKNGETGDKNIVLVVEDNADVRKYVRGPLEPHYTVVEAKDGREGIEKAKEVIPDLIVSDIMMPEVDGYELCRTLKTEVKTSHIPIILLTAKASQQSVVEGLETGADDYITKPFNTQILMTRIRNLIRLRCQLQEKIQKQMLLQPAEIIVSSVDREFIEELQQVIEKHLSDPEFHVEGMSKKLYMNRATLYRKVMALTGETPTQFIRSYRLKRGAQLLRDNFGNVSEVALEVGFSNMAYFAKCFKEKFHQLPSTYQASES
ncbi:MAG: response regulator [bacterium]|nr:response regulator [bacterium]